MYRNLTREGLIGIVLLLGLLIFAVARYPVSLSRGGLISFLATAGALVAYAAVAVWAARVRALAWSEAYVFFKHEDAGTGPALAKRLLEVAGAAGA